MALSSLSRQPVALGVHFVEVMHALQIRHVGIGVNRTRTGQLLDRRGFQGKANLCDDGARDLGLDGENAAQFSVVALRPQV